MVKNKRDAASDAEKGHGGEDHSMKKWVARFYDETGVVKLPARIVAIVCVFLILLVGSGFLYYHSPEEKNWLICIFYKLSGYYCPGCGSGRACYCILHGRFAQAFHYNPLLCILSHGLLCISAPVGYSGC